VTNDLAFVRDVVAFLSVNSVNVRVFGGWAEELHGLCPPRPHDDVDLLVEGESFDAVDRLVSAYQLEEIVGKRLPHKRAVVIAGVMIELFLVRHDDAGPYTLFWGNRRHDWPRSDGVEIAGIPVASVGNISSYRAAHDRLRIPVR
jgi:hypothetical protein